MLPPQKLTKALKRFITKNENKRELKRALAVKMYLAGCTLKETAKHLDSSYQFVWKWKKNFLSNGLKSLKLAHKGSEGYLTKKARCDIKYWLKERENCTVEELEDYVLKRYKICFKSRQSYYDLLKEAGLSFKESHKINPGRNAREVSNSRYRLKKTIVLSGRSRDTGKAEAFLLSG